MKLLTNPTSIILNILIALLLFIGIVSIYSSTFTANTVSEGKGKLNSQLIILIIGLFIYFLVSRFDYNYFKLIPVASVIYTITITLLFIVLFQSEEVRGTNRWISIGFFNIQPAEYAKITLIIVNSILFSLKHDFYENLASKILKYLPFLHILDEKTSFFRQYSLFAFMLSALFNIPIILLVFKQPALGNTLIITAIWLSMFFILIGNQLKHLLYLVFIIIGANITLNIVNLSVFKQIFLNIGPDVKINLIVLLFSLIIIILFSIIFKAGIIKSLLFLFLGIFMGLFPAFLWKNTLDYQKDRIESFLNPSSEKNIDRWQVEQSKIAIGSGKVYGKGFLKGSQSKLKYLPFAYTDFIFASLSEEFGFLGSLFVLFLFLTLLLSLLFAYGRIDDSFGAALLVGIFFMLLYHIFVNIGMNLGILPVTGIPLPFISYGGSSVIANLICLGIAQNIISKSYTVDTNRQTMITSDSLWGVRSY